MGQARTSCCVSRIPLSVLDTLLLPSPAAVLMRCSWRLSDRIPLVSLCRVSVTHSESYDVEGLGKLLPIGWGPQECGTCISQGLTQVGTGIWPRISLFLYSPLTLCMWVQVCVRVLVCVRTRACVHVCYVCVFSESWQGSLKDSKSCPLTYILLFLDPNSWCQLTETSLPSLFAGLTNPGCPSCQVTLLPPKASGGGCEFPLSTVMFMSCPSGPMLLLGTLASRAFIRACVCFSCVGFEMISLNKVYTGIDFRSLFRVVCFVIWFF